MKIVMTLLVRDEEDIIRQNIEYHLSQGVDFIIATDNRSIDSTGRILKEYEARGKLLYLYEERDNYNQGKWVTSMARLAFTDYGANWVINNDADEFWWPNEGSLRDTFQSLFPSVNVVMAHRRNFVFLSNNNNLIPFYRKMIYKDLLSVNLLGKPLPHKIAHTGNADVTVSQGNHAVGGIGTQSMANDVIEIFHFPIRTRSQFLSKILKGGAAYSRNDELPRNLGRAWRQLYEKYRSFGNIDKDIQEKVYDDDRLQRELREGRIAVDYRLRDYLSNLMTDQ
jgi:hypothetical protein